MVTALIPGAATPSVGGPPGSEGARAPPASTVDPAPALHHDPLGTLDGSLRACGIAYPVEVWPVVHMAHWWSQLAPLPCLDASLIHAHHEVQSAYCSTYQLLLTVFRVQCYI